MRVVLPEICPRTHSSSSVRTHTACPSCAARGQPRAAPPAQHTHLEGVDERLVEVGELGLLDGPHVARAEGREVRVCRRVVVGRAPLGLPDARREAEVVERRGLVGRGACGGVHGRGLGAGGGKWWWGRVACARGWLYAAGDGHR